VTCVHIWCKYATIQSGFTLSVTISRNDLLEQELCALCCRKGRRSRNGLKDFLCLAWLRLGNVRLCAAKRHNW